MKCLEKTGTDAILEHAFQAQGGPLTWQRFSMKTLQENQIYATLIEAVKRQAIIEMSYSAGSTPGEKRRVHPNGIVRSLDGDFLVAYAEKDQRSKRYYIEKIVSADFV
jgi:predicted DNA-binding transcriptional regulator YafY